MQWLFAEMKQIMDLKDMRQGTQLTALMDEKV